RGRAPVRTRQGPRRGKGSGRRGRRRDAARARGVGLPGRSPCNAREGARLLRTFHDDPALAAAERILNYFEANKLPGMELDLGESSQIENSPPAPKPLVWRCLCSKPISVNKWLCKACADEKRAQGYTGPLQPDELSREGR